MKVQSRVDGLRNETKTIPVSKEETENGDCVRGEEIKVLRMEKYAKDMMRDNYLLFSAVAGKVWCKQGTSVMNI